MRFAGFLVQAGPKVAVPAIESPRVDIGSANAALKLSVEWEMEGTRQINALLDRVLQENGRMAVGLLNGFVGEQLEGSLSVEGLLAVVQRAGPNGQLFVDDFLARRGAKS